MNAVDWEKQQLPLLVKESSFCPCLLQLQSAPTFIFFHMVGEFGSSKPVHPDGLSGFMGIP